MNISNKIKYFISVFVLFPIYIQAQGEFETVIFDRLQAISVNGIDYYNIDGINISCQITNISFSKKNISSGLSINESLLTNSVSFISQKNYLYTNIDTLCDNIIQYNSNYFIENELGNITHIIFMSPGKTSIKLEKVLVNLIIKKEIPKNIFNKEFFQSINFAGHNVDLGTYFCKWANVNNIQCPYRGQMNWSMHSDSLDAVKSIELQRYITAHCKSKDLKPITDEIINIIFEGQKLKAQRITYQLENETATVLGNTGDGNTKTLIIYYIIAPIRENYISCIMSYWNNDMLEKESGLPLLIEKIIKIEN